MIIDITKKYTYRNGEPARILCTDAYEKSPVIALTTSGKVTIHRADGKSGIDDEESPWDLIECPPEPQPAITFKDCLFIGGNPVSYEESEGCIRQIARMEGLVIMPRSHYDEIIEGGRVHKVTQIMTTTTTTESTPVSSSLSYPPPESEWPEKPDPGPGMVWERMPVEGTRPPGSIALLSSDHDEDVLEWKKCSRRICYDQTIVFRAVPAPVAGGDFPPVGTRLRFTVDGFFGCDDHKRGDEIIVENVSDRHFEAGGFEFSDDWRDGLEVVPPSDPEESRAKAALEDGWTVPIGEPHTFGQCVEHGISDQLVLVLHRGTSGWKTPENMPHCSLSHQIYAKNLEPLFSDSDEIVVVGLNTGTWQTVWAKDARNISHPLAANGLSLAKETPESTQVEEEGHSWRELASHEVIEEGDEVKGIDFGEWIPAEMTIGYTVEKAAIRARRRVIREPKESDMGIPITEPSASYPPPESESLTLVVGQYYENRRGEVVGPIERSGRDAYPFKIYNEQGYSSWTANGQRLATEQGDTDLIRAVPAPDPMKVLRWSNWGPDNTMATKFNGEYVRYADHLAALKQAIPEGR